MPEIGRSLRHQYGVYSRGLRPLRESRSNYTLKNMPGHPCQAQVALALGENETR